MNKAASKPYYFVVNALSLILGVVLFFAIPPKSVKVDYQAFVLLAPFVLVFVSWMATLKRFPRKGWPFVFAILHSVIPVLAMLFFIIVLLMTPSSF